MTAPANGASRLLFCSRNCPTALADAPNAMNTTEKPTTKEKAEVSRLPRGRSPCRNCSTPIPDNIEMYPGTSGSTHGERNEVNPATNAAKIETCIASLLLRGHFVGFAPASAVRCGPIVPYPAGRVANPLRP